MTVAARQDVVALTGGLSACLVFVYLVLVEGGYPETVWYPAAIILLALTAAVLSSGAELRRALPGDLLVAAAALAGFTLWSFATVFWADDRQLALAGSAKTLLYLAVFVLFAILPWRRRSVLALVSALTLGFAAVAFAFFLVPAVGSDSSGPFLFGRLSEPVGYPNGNSALLLGAFWPAVILASRREPHPLLRASLFATAGGLLQLTIATQSRGAVIAGAATAAALLVIVPGRLRLLAALAPLGVVGMATMPRFLQILDDELADRSIVAAVEDARATLLMTLVLLWISGLALALADRRLSGVHLTGRARLVALAAVAATAAAAIAFVALVAPLGEVREQIEDARLGVGTSRFSERDLDADRVELWRVGVAEFRRHPVVGIGVDNFGIPYARERRTVGTEPLYPHSLPVRVASQTGLVGSFLFVAFLVGCGFAVLNAARPSRAPWLVAAAAFPAVYWLVHGSIDWLWEIPALTAPALALLAAGGRTDREGGPAQRLPDSLRIWGPRVTVATSLTAATLLVPLWLSARDVELAGRSWTRDPAHALDRLERAGRLNPVADSPAVTAGAIASRQRNFEEMARQYGKALERKPESWHSHLQLAVAQSRIGREKVARTSIRKARVLNPLESILVRVERQLANGVRPDPREIDRHFILQARSEGLIR